MTLLVMLASSSCAGGSSCSDVGLMDLRLRGRELELRA